MAKKKNHYYVLVLTTEGPKFVTKVNNFTHYAEYNELEKPKEFDTKSYADDVSFGLTVNFITAYTITTPYEITSQPYRYDSGKFNWVWNKNKEEK